MATPTPLLTVGIPTFNNPNGARTQVESLISQIRTLNAYKKVEILVSDNSENLETSDGISAVNTQEVAFEYRRNSSNIGYDRNVDLLLTESKGAYCWLLSDNDPVASEALSTILFAIENYGQCAHLIIDTSLGVEGVAQYANYEDLAQGFGISLPGGLVSQNIFKRSLLPSDRSKYYGNHWFHLALLFEICAKKPVILLPNLFVSGDSDRCSWAKDGMTFVTFASLFSIVKSLRQYGYGESFCAAQEAAFKKNLPHQLVTGKIYGLHAKREHFRTINTFFRADPLNRLYCYILLVTPALVFKLLKNLKDVWKRSS